MPLNKQELLLRKLIELKNKMKQNLIKKVEKNMKENYNNFKSNFKKIRKIKYKNRRKYKT